LYQLFAKPDPALKKRYASKALNGKGPSMVAIKSATRLYLELHDVSGGGVSLTGKFTARGGNVPAGSENISFALAAGEEWGFLPQPINASGIIGAVDLESLSPDFIMERLHIASADVTRFGA
jgi:hypothetical protein